MGSAGLCPSRMGNMTDRKKHAPPPPTCVTCRMWSFCVKGCLCINPDPQSWGVLRLRPFGRGRGWKYAPPRRVILPKLVVLGQAVNEGDDSCHPLSRVTQGHRNRHASISDCDFLLMIQSNRGGPISYRFRDKWRFQSKIANFSNHHVFNAPAEWVLLGIG